MAIWLKKKRSIEKTGISVLLKNINFVLSYYWKAGKSLFVYRSFIAVLETMGLYVTVNIARWIFSSIEKNNYWQAMIYIGLSSLIIIISNVVSYYYVYLKEEIIQTDVRTQFYLELICKIKGIDQCDFETSQFYDQYVRSIMDIDTQPERVIDSIFRCATSIMQVFTVGTVIAGIHPIYLIFSVLAALIVMFFGNLINKVDFEQVVSNTTNIRKMDYVKRLAYEKDFLENLKLANSFAGLISNKYSNSAEAYKATMIHFGKKKNKYAIWMVISNTLFTIILPWLFLINSLFKHGVTIADATVIIGAMSSLPNTMQSILREINQFKLQTLHIENIKCIFNHLSKIEKNEGIALDKNIEEVVVKDVSFSYGQENVLNEIYLDLSKGETVAIVGVNGAGKTTITKLLQRLYDVNGGNIFINGRNIKDYNVIDYRKHIVSMQQNFQVYGFSIAENILLRKIETEEDVKLISEALKHVGLYEKVMAMEHGIETCISREFEENGVYLSGGEMQRLALARLYAVDADVIIMDEPTSALDAISEDEILNQMLNVFQDKIIIVISHKLSLVKEVNKILVIDNHKVLEVGSHNELMDEEGLYYQMYIKQAQRYNIK